MVGIANATRKRATLSSLLFCHVLLETCSGSPHRIAFGGPGDDWDRR